MPKENVCAQAAKARVISFLESIYTSVAETLPDHRDDLNPGDSFVVYQIDSAVDPYSEFDAVQRQLSQHSDLTRQHSMKQQKNTKKFQKKKSVVINAEKVALGLEERFLPPGRMMDYFEQYKAILHDSDECVSFATFWRTWCSDYSHMKFRTSSSHSVCTTCTRHKLLIREFCGHVAARQKQQQLLAKHLREQFLDRSLYWEKRGLSRLGQIGEVTLIIDSMDQQKFCYPRAEIYKAKDLSTFVRPRSHVTAVLCHGHFVLITVAEHNLPKNANCMTEILGHCLTLLQRKGLDTTKLRFRIHSDNTVRETKNNIVLSWLGSLTGRGLIAGGALACLRSGHSHEDVDQLFGNLSYFMARKGRYARHTGDFVVLIRQWLNELKRPFEKDKFCVKLDELRDWPFDSKLSIMFLICFSYCFFGGLS